MTISGQIEPTLQYQELFQRPGPIPDFRLESVFQPRDMPLVARSPDSTTSSSSAATTSCGPKDTTGFCERSVGASQHTTIPVILGVALPLSFAFVLLIVLHRRHVRKLKQEDAEDKHKSLDFGMDGAPVSEKKKRMGSRLKKGPEMRTVEEHHSDRRDRQLSMDLAMTNPYLLPPEVQQSRESLHSLSRSINTGDDKYRATTFIPDDGSLRSPSSLRGRDDASIYTYSSRVRTETESTKGLLPNGHSHLNEVVPIIQIPEPAAKGRKLALLSPVGPDGARESYLSTNSDNGHIAAMRASNNYLGQYISGGANKHSVEDRSVRNSAAELDSNSAQGGIQVQVQELPTTVLRNVPKKQDSIVPDAAGFDFNIPPNTYELSSGPEPALPRLDVTPAVDSTTQIYEAPGHEAKKDSYLGSTKIHESVTIAPSEQKRASVLPDENPDINIISAYEGGDDAGSDYYDEEVNDTYDIDDYRDTLGYDPRLLTMGTRPLPPDDPAENPEERAIRIRSFYKEYFEETTKPGGEKARLSYFDGSENYIDDYYGSNNHVSYGYPPTQNHDNGYGQAPAYGRGQGPAHGSMQSVGHNSGYGYGPRVPSAMSARGPPGRHRATISNGSYMSAGPGPRAYSSASQRMPGPRTKHASKLRPPPQPLAVLPSPSMMKDDSMLPNAIDYAPPQMFKKQRAGTPDSLKGGVKPYAPTGKAYNPLVSSFDDLSVLPSPHQLRRSGTFSALDFAPPRFATPASGSDSGSIRSNRSGMSAKQLHHIRKGAYRLSRVPKEVAGTREELTQALKPQWNAR